jgi:hypothetical protein
MNAKTIRTNLYELVTKRLFEKDCESLLDHHRKFGSQTELFDEPLCPFINRLCPDDLCYLPAGHDGTKEGYHITGTVAYNYAEKFGYGKTDMGAAGSSREELIHMGVKLQDINA